jgi:hypothetical protein
VVLRGAITFRQHFAHSSSFAQLLWYSVLIRPPIGPWPLPLRPCSYFDIGRSIWRLVVSIIRACHPDSLLGSPVVQDMATTARAFTRPFSTKSLASTNVPSTPTTCVSRVLLGRHSSSVADSRSNLRGQSWLRKCLLGESVVRASSFTVRSLSTRSRSPVVVMATATNQTGEQVSCKSKFFHSYCIFSWEYEKWWVQLDRFRSAFKDTKPL